MIYKYKMRCYESGSLAGSGSGLYTRIPDQYPDPDPGWIRIRFVHPDSGSTRILILAGSGSGLHTRIPDQYPDPDP